MLLHWKINCIHTRTALQQQQQRSNCVSSTTYLVFTARAVGYATRVISRSEESDCLSYRGTGVASRGVQVINYQPRGDSRFVDCVQRVNYGPYHFGVKFLRYWLWAIRGKLRNSSKRLLSMTSGFYIISIAIFA